MNETTIKSMEESIKLKVLFEGTGRVFRKKQQILILGIFLFLVPVILVVLKLHELNPLVLAIFIFSELITLSCVWYVVLKLEYKIRMDSGNIVLKSSFSTLVFPLSEIESFRLVNLEGHRLIELNTGNFKRLLLVNKPDQLFQALSQINK